MKKIGLVQIAELNWSHRRREQYELKDGILIPKKMGKVLPNTEFVYLPLSIGLLQAYAQKYAAQPESYVFLPAIFKRIPVIEAVTALSEADIVGFSTYVWNIHLSLKIASELKRQCPDTLIVFGGPQVPGHAETFLREHPQVDIVVHGEGEENFLSILECPDSTQWGSLRSVSYLDANGRYVATPRSPRLRDLSVLPSPYLAGVFDGLLETNPDIDWLVMWETNRGCPFSCTYCDWGSAVAGKVNRFAMERLEAEIDWFVSHKVSHLFICDANFGILPRDLEIAERLIERYEAANLPVAISIQNTKNSTERSFQIQQLFSRSKLVHFGATLSLQSVSEQALADIKRENISLEAFHNLHAKFRNAGIETYTDLIVGLPGETYDSFADGLAEVLARGQHNRIAFYNCSVLPNAEMGDAAYQQRHGIEWVPVPIVHEHEGLHRTDRDEAQEYLNTIISTRTLSREDWVRTRVLAWIVDCLHFNRVLMVVAIVIHELYALSYRDFYERIMTSDKKEYPICAQLCKVFTDLALGIQQGKAEYIASPQWLNIWWPADQYALIMLVNEDKLEGFYEEIRALFSRWLAESGNAAGVSLLNEAVLLNRSMLRVPKQYEDIHLVLSANLYDFVRGIVSGHAVELVRNTTYYRIDRSSTVWVSYRAWCEDVIVQYYRRADFFYPVHNLGPSEESLGFHSRAMSDRPAESIA